MEKGVMNTSRRQSDGLLRMSPKKREASIKQFIAACNVEQLIPFIKITEENNGFREIEYEINAWGSQKVGVTNKSRKEANFINYMKSEQREQYIKQWIASCNVGQLVPFIKIIKHDRYFREIEYEIDIR